LAQVLFIVSLWPDSSIKLVEAGATYRSKAKRMDLYTKSCNVLLLKFTSQMAFDESGL
jgi:hypothetical protein